MYFLDAFLIKKGLEDLVVVYHDVFIVGIEINLEWTRHEGMEIE